MKNNKLFFDTHTHYNHYNFNIIQNMILNSMNNFYILNVGYDIDSSYTSILLANKYSNIYTSIGIHPLYTKFINSDYLVLLKKMLENNNKIVAIGEIGLDNYGKDYYIKQKKIFIEQLYLAHEYNLPVILHIRDLYQETFDIINYYKIHKGIVHCFSCDNLDILKKFIKIGFYISFSGNITFKKNNYYINKIINSTPENNILLETDSPYLAPNPFRGRINTSFNIKYIAETIAKIKNKDINYIYNLTMSNTFKILNIKI